MYFVVTFGPLKQQEFLTATPTYYGWIGVWNSAACPPGYPNGSYDFQSVVTQTGGATCDESTCRRDSGQLRRLPVGRPRSPVDGCRDIFAGPPGVRVKRNTLKAPHPGRCDRPGRWRRTRGTPNDGGGRRHVTAETVSQAASLLAKRRRRCCCQVSSTRVRTMA